MASLKFIKDRIEALDRLGVRLNMYLVQFEFQQTVNARTCVTAAENDNDELVCNRSTKATGRCMLYQ